MKCFAFDKKDNNKWKKDWDSLVAKMSKSVCNIRTDRERGIEDIRAAVDRGLKALVLVHKGPCESLVHKALVELSNEYPNYLYIMYVHSSGCSQLKMESKRIYAAKRPVPSDVA